MERRGVIWDKNNNLKRVDQDSFIETASYNIKNIEHWLQINCLMYNVLLTSRYVRINSLGIQMVRAVRQDSTRLICV